MSQIISFDEYKRSKFFKGLDGLRFISITAVVWHHTVGGIPSLNITNYGFLGVDLFFVISGFLIVTLLIRERDRVGSISLRYFYIRRALRIFPVYYGFILSLALLYTFIATDSEFGKQYVSDLPLYLLHLANLSIVGLSIIWSLSSEEQFYLIWPVIEKLSEPWVTGILLFSLLANQFINFFRNELAEFIGSSTFSELSIFQVTFTPILLGVALAHFLHKERSFRIFERLFFSSWSSVILFGLLVVVISNLPADISGFPRLLVHSVMMLLVAGVVLSKGSAFDKVLNTRIIARIGVVSYGIYLFHIHAIIVADKLLEIVGILNGYVLFIVGFLFSYLVAEISYRFYEIHFLRLKTRFNTTS